MAKKSPASQAFSHLADTARNSPAAGRLGDAAKAYAFARGTKLAEQLGGHAGNLTTKLQDFTDNGGQLNFKGEAGKRILGGASPVKAGLGAATSKVKDTVKSLFGKGKKGKGSGKPKVVNVIESIDVGVPVSVAYDQWTQFHEFSKFMKGVESVEQQDETTTTWRAKVAKSRRSWQGKVVEQVPDRRIVWTSDGKKGSSKGVVTFHPLADDLTRILLDLEYYPTGMVEKTGNIWRAVGRRTRLDLKNFRRFVMSEGEATGSWRGEIRDGEVVKQPDEQDEESGRRSDEASEGRSRGSRDSDSADGKQSDAADRKQSKASSERQGKGRRAESRDDDVDDESPADRRRQSKERPVRSTRSSSSGDSDDSSDNGGSGPSRRREASARR